MTRTAHLEDTVLESDNCHCEHDFKLHTRVMLVDKTKQFKAFESDMGCEQCACVEYIPLAWTGEPTGEERWHTKWRY